MFLFIKKIIKKTIVIITRTLSRTRLGKLIGEIVITDAMKRKRSVIHNNTQLTFTVPNQLNRFRIDTFSIKEPETLEWIDKLPHNSTLWDIGANVGLYTCYAAKARGCQVFAFEPSVFNLELLARNISLNNVTSQVVIVPLPLSDNLAFNTLNMQSTEWGAAKSTFGQNL
mgnify:CR=1 FL=1